jgi:hypothetical protein
MPGVHGFNIGQPFCCVLRLCDIPV